MQEPVLSGRRIDPRALMRSVDRRRSLMQHNSFLVRAIDILRPEHRLPARLHTSCRGKDVIVAISLIELRSLNRRLRLMPVIDEFSVVQHSRAVRLDRRQIQHALKADAASGKCRHHVRFPVVIPEGAGIDPAHNLSDIGGFTPLSPRVSRLTHKDSLVGHGNKYIICPVVETNGRRPCPTAMHRLVIIREGQSVHDIVDNLPADQILGMQQGHRRRVTETGRHHEIIPADPDCVRVGIIRVQNRIPVGSVAVIRDPHFLSFSVFHIRSVLRRYFTVACPTFAPIVSSNRRDG